MSKTDITKTNLYLKKMICVIKTDMNNNKKPIYVDGRHSDAFVYILSGSCSYKFDDDYEFTVNQGDILYLAYDAVYTMYVHTTNYRVIYCDFEFDCDSVRKSDVYPAQNVSDAEKFFFRLVNAYTHSSASSFSECMSLLYSIYGIVLKTTDAIYIEQSTKSKIVYAKEYVDTHFADVSLSITFLSEQADMSEVYFRKLFKQQYNVSPSQYIISVRLKKAKQLLNYKFLSLEECAVQSGFSSLQYFCRVFKSTTGITPSKYRNKK